MDDQDWLATRIEEHGAHLRAIAYRMLGSGAEADDAVQEAWLRLSRADASEIENLRGWLTTVIARVCLDMLRSRRARREAPLNAQDLGERMGQARGTDPEAAALLADSVGAALLVVLERLTPAERVAFVLHDVFAVPFDEIAPIVGRSPAAARQLASRARRRVRQTDDSLPAGLSAQRKVVDAFLAAARDGDFDELLGLLDPDVVLRADAATVLMGTPAEVRGADGVARTFSGGARAAQPALIDGAVGLVWAQGGRPRVVFALVIAGDRITDVELIADPDRIARLELTLIRP